MKVSGSRLPVWHCFLGELSEEPSIASKGRGARGWSLCADERPPSAGVIGRPCALVGPKIEPAVACMCEPRRLNIDSVRQTRSNSSLQGVRRRIHESVLDDRGCCWEPKQRNASLAAPLSSDLPLYPSRCTAQRPLYSRCRAVQLTT